MEMENLETERKLYKKHFHRRFMYERKLRKVLDSMIGERNEMYGITEERMEACEGMANDASTSSGLTELVVKAIDYEKLSQKMKLDMGADRQYQIRMRVSWKGVSSDDIGRALQ